MTQGRDVIVGRSREMEQLRLALAQLRGANSPVVVELTGPAGIGKTTLLNYLADEAAKWGFTCVRASGSRAERDFAFAGLTALFDDALSEGPVAARLDPHSVEDLAAVLPSLRSKVVDYSTVLRGDPVNPLLVCHATRHAVNVLAQQAGGLLVLMDDVQWMDEMTLSVIDYCVRHRFESPVLIATARRSGQSSTASLTDSRGPVLPGASALAESSARQSLELEPLTPEHAESLVQGVPTGVRESLLAAADGNPFFLTQLASHVRSLGPQARPGGDLNSYPTVVATAILDDLRALPPAAQRLAWAAAALGDPFDVRLAGQVGELGDGETLESIDTLTDASLVLPVDSHGIFRFRHPIIASVIYDSIRDGWRLAAHERAARLLRMAGADPLRIAIQLERSAQVGDRAAIDELESAALSARALAPKTASRLLKTAIRLTPAAADWAIAGRLRLIAERADVLIATGDFEEAHAELVDALRLLPPDDHLTQAYLVANLMRVEKWLGRQSVTLETLRTLMAQLPSDGSFERILLERLLLHELGVSGELEEMRQLGASLAANTDGKPDQLFSIAVIRAFGEAMIGSPERADTHTKEAVALLDRLTDDQLMLSLELQILLSGTEELIGHLDDALRHARRAIQLATKSENLLVGFWLRIVVDSSLTKLGDLSEAAEVAAECEQIARMTHQPGLISVAIARRSALAVQLGDVSSAGALVEEGEVYLELVRDSYLRTIVSCSLAPTLLALGQPERCMRILLHEAGGDELTETAHASRPIIYEYLVEAELARGNTESARRWSERATTSSQELGLALSTCSAERAQARVLLACDKAGEAVDHAVAAIQAATVAGAPIEIARSQHLVGQAMAAAGQKDEAIAAMRQALDIFHACGAAGFIEPVLGDLRALGVRTSGKRTARGATGVDSLSSRERVVAELVADGLTNPQIAARLVLSRRTVESHLVRIFAKLDVDSRTEVAAQIRRSRITAVSGSSPTSARREASPQHR